MQLSRGDRLRSGGILDTHRDLHLGRSDKLPTIVAGSEGVLANMSAKIPKRPVSAPSGRDDPRVAALMKAFSADPKLAPVIDAFEERKKVEGGRKFGSNGLKVNGTLFALFTQGTLVVKLPNERVAALVSSRVGKQFDPGHGRLMKGWLTVTAARASWIDLAKEAHDFVTGSKR